MSCLPEGTNAVFSVGRKTEDKKGPARSFQLFSKIFKVPFMWAEQSRCNQLKPPSFHAATLGGCVPSNPHNLPSVRKRAETSTHVAQALSRSVHSVHKSWVLYKLGIFITLIFYLMITSPVLNNHSKSHGAVQSWVKAVGGLVA
jgi:hypothetical protein